MSSIFSTVGDRHFDALCERFPLVRRERLCFEARLDPERFEQLQVATMLYLSACLGERRCLSEPLLLGRLLERRGEIANHGPTGQVVPKRDHILEFNLLHRTVAEIFASLPLRDAIDTIDLPFSLRMIYGSIDPARPLRPYASAKGHTDVWAGVPPDAMVVVLPVLGDIDDITIEFGELAPEQELEWMKPLPDFADGKSAPLAVPYHDVSMKLGHLYVADARGMHRTVRRKPGGVRVSIDFRFRLKGNEAYRALATHGGRVAWKLERAAPYPRWLGVGKTSLMLFDETMAEATANGRTVREGPDYGTDYTPAQLFDEITELS